MTKIPYVFLMQASNILGSTEKGLTGGEIAQLFSAYSFDFHNENVPHIQAPLNAPNKRTAILENLVAFPAEQQYEIIRELSPCVRIVVTPNNQVKGGNKEQRCPDTVKRENKLY